ncbi:MAG: efflux RND transporter permease subunit [Phycisphaerae bacterium]|nr:efflux RND transporter permease subunit [Phycisphaerae bacterium]
MIVSTYSLKNRITVAVLVLLISLAGVFSYVTLPRESAPDVPIPLVLVMTPHHGVSPADIESSVTQKIEKKLTGIKGVKEVRSTSAEGMSMVQVEFNPDIRIEDALQYVRDKVDQAKGDLPFDAESPIVREINVSEFPILYMNISGPISPVMLKDIGDRLKDAIEQNVPGVLSVSVLGGLEPEIRIEVDPDRLAFYGLTIPEVMSLIPSEHVNISAGGLATPGTKFNVRIPAEFKDAKDITNIPIANRNGRQIFLLDVARVVDTFKDRETVSRLNGESSLTIAVQKRVGANIIDIIDGVKMVVEEGKQYVPQAVSFTYTMDRSDDIREMVAELENHIITALILVILVMLVAIGVRASLVAALAVPLSLFMTFAVLELMGITLNMVVLFSLILSVGMLVDDAVVIVENIYRHMQMGKKRFQAAREACEEVAWPVITSTLTICAAFFPMVFWPGIVGSFFKYIPITIIIALLSSLFVALVVSPVICTVIPGRAEEGHGNGPILRSYRRFLRLAINHRWTALGLCVLLLMGMGMLYGKKGHGVEFFPDLDPKNAVINIRGPQGTTLAQTDAIAMDIERRLMGRLITKDNPGGEMENVVSNLGATTGGGDVIMFGGGLGGPHEGNISLVFPEFEHRSKSSSDTVAEIRAELTDITGAEIKVEKQAMGPPTGAAVTVRLIGEDLKELEKLNNRARAMILNVPGLVNLRSDMELTRPELVFRVDRDRARMAGVDTATIGNFLKTSIYGTTVGTYHLYNDEYDITVRLPEAQRENIPDILRLRVPNMYGQAVPLSTVGSFDYSGGLGTINRVDQNRVVTLTGDAEGRLAPAVLADVQEILSKYGRNRVIESDVTDWPALLAGLRGDSELAKRIGKHLAQDKDGRAVKAMLKSGDANPSAELKNALLRGLNVALADPKLVDAKLAQQMALGAEAAAMIAAKPPGLLSSPNTRQEYDGQVVRRNRIALDNLVGAALTPTVKLDLPMNYKVVYAGQDEEMQKAISFLIKAGIVSAVLIVLIMVAQFNTLSVPFVIMITVVFSWIGVLLGLLVTGIPFGVMMTGIGVLSLTGIVVRNGIVLMDYTRQLQRQGMDVVEACVEAGAIRLRPVLLVAACTSLGLVPIALGWSYDFHQLRMVWESEASEWWMGMAVAVIFGLTFATILTLVVVPCLYIILYKMAAKLGLGGLKKGDEEEEASLAETAEASAKA